MLPMRRWAMLVIGSIGLAAPGSRAASQDAAPPPPGAPPGPPAAGPGAPAAAPRGLVVNTAAAQAGYTLFAPLNSTTTYLIDMQGTVVHSWPSRYTPGQAAYLLDDGSLLRCGHEPGNRHFGGGGIGGRVERIAPDGTVEWEFVCADEQRCLHHDIEPLPGGHVLLIAWEKKTRAEVLAAGGDPQRFPGDELWPDCILEVEPQGARGGRVVWEWHVWDHLVQDYDAGKPNYGVVAGHPELVDLNFRPRAPRATPAEIRRLRSLGYVGGAPDEEEDDEEEGAAEDVRGRPRRGPGGVDMRADWCHTNSVAYNARLDQIVLSVHNFNEIWVIDHGTTTAEAAGHAGGRCGRGGDLLYRWGNPRAYGAGGARDQQLFAQHDARWIPEGAPGAGHLLVFNNGIGRPDGAYSSVLEIAPPLQPSGRYTLERGRAFGPARPCWEYAAASRGEFFSASISGAERLANGNTLICSGEQGRLFEVSPAGQIVWEYVNPYQERRPPGVPGGPPGGFRGPRRSGDVPSDGGGREGSGAAAGRGGGPSSRPSDGPRPPPPGVGPGGPWGPPGGGPGGRWGPPGAGPWGPPGDGGWGPPPGGPPGAGIFRAARLAPDHPGVRRLLEGRGAGQGGGGAGRRGVAGQGDRGE